MPAPEFKTIQYEKTDLHLDLTDAEVIEICPWSIMGKKCPVSTICPSSSSVLFLAITARKSTVILLVLRLEKPMAISVLLQTALEDYTRRSVFAGRTRLVVTTDR